MRGEGSLRLSLLGAVLEADSRAESGWEEAAVALAGPLANLCSLPLALGTRQGLLAGASALLGSFNLLPAQPLDGSRIIHGLLSVRGDLNRAEEWTCFLSWWVTGGLLALGAVLSAMGNRSLLLVALWMALRDHIRQGREERGWKAFSAGLSP